VREREREREREQRRSGVHQRRVCRVWGVKRLQGVTLGIEEEAEAEHSVDSGKNEEQSIDGDHGEKRGGGVESQ
jgi:hypothetical protein